MARSRKAKNKCDVIIGIGFIFFFFFKQKTAYEIYQCDWSSDVCSSDLLFLEEDVYFVKELSNAQLWVGTTDGRILVREPGVDRKSVV